MNINVLIICITVLICLISILVVSYRVLKRKYNQRDFELALEKYKFFGSISTENIDKEIEKLIARYFNYYVVYNFQIRGKKYIKEDEMDKAVKDITKNIVLEMSELYSFYFRLIYNIDTEEQLTAKVYEMVTDSMIAYASEYNAPKE